MPGPKQKTTAVFIEDAISVHGNEYTYNSAVYNGVKINLLVTCRTHGDFSVTPSNHLAGRGCPLCAKQRVGTKNAQRGKQIFSRTLEDFVNKAQEKHNNRYDYTSAVYANNYTKLTIVCNVHGQFSQTPDTHLRGAGCPSCAHTRKFSLKSILWLETIMQTTGVNIQHALNGGEFLIPGTKIKVDGFSKETNTVYEYHGDRWHGNPKVFQPKDKCHPYDTTVTAGELYTRTIQREDVIRQKGYNLVVRWETE